MLTNFKINWNAIEEAKKDYISKNFSEKESNDFIDSQVNVIMLFPGIYETNLNFNYTLKYFSNNKPKKEWNNIFENENSYGICDNYEQILQYYPELNSLDRKFIISMTPIIKKDESEKDGWRWHKWGEYIGNQNPQHEYLYDEEGIEKVYCYHIYEIE